jgi:hypothetical protein
MIEKKCKCCKKPIQVRLSDHRRGWGKYCSKSCKAKKQAQITGIVEPDYRARGRSVNQMKNGRYARSKIGGQAIERHWDGTELFYANFSNEENSDI